MRVWILKEGVAGFIARKVTIKKRVVHRKKPGIFTRIDQPKPMKPGKATASKPVKAPKPSKAAKPEKHISTIDDLRRAQAEKYRSIT